MEDVATSDKPTLDTRTSSANAEYSVLIRLSAFLLAILIVQVLTVHDRRVIWVGEVPYRVLLDDVMITLRVAQNIALGNGPYYNPGEHLAANTSLFWPYALAPLMNPAAPWSAVEKVQFLSLFFTAMTLLATSLIPKRTAVAVAATIAAASSNSILTYASSGWEHIPQMLFVTLALLPLWNTSQEQTIRTAPAALLALCVAFLCRPDTIIIALPIATWVALQLIHRRTVLLVLSLFATSAVLGLYLLLHYKLYEALVPNTYFLKIGYTDNIYVEGLTYLHRNLTDGCNMFPILAVVCLAACKGKSRLSHGKILCCLCVVLYLAYVVAIGGDFFLGGRFLLVLTPFALFAMMDLVLEVSRTSKFVSVGVVTMFALSSFISVSRATRRMTPEVVASGTSVTGEAANIEQQLTLVPILRRTLVPESGEVGVFYAGTLAYYLPEFRFADFLGKADAHVARLKPYPGPVGHNKWDFDYTLNERNVIAIPFRPLAAPQASKMIKERAPHWYGPALQLNPAIEANFEFISSSELGLKGSYGLYIRRAHADAVRNGVLQD
jgi:hypothetical protein